MVVITQYTLFGFGEGRTYHNLELKGFEHITKIVHLHVGENMLLLLCVASLKKST